MLVGIALSASDRLLQDRSSGARLRLRGPRLHSATEEADAEGEAEDGTPRAQAGRDLHSHSLRQGEETQAIVRYAFLFLFLDFCPFCDRAGDVSLAGEPWRRAEPRSEKSEKRSRRLDVIFFFK